MLRKQPAQLSHVVMRENPIRLTGRLNRIDQRCMSELIDKKSSPAAQLADGGGGLNRGVIGLISAGKKHRRLHLLPLRDSLLGGLMFRALYPLTSGAARAGAHYPVRLARRADRRHHLRMMRQSQIVVGGEIDQNASIALNARRVQRPADPSFSIKMSLLKPG